MTTDSPPIPPHFERIDVRLKRAFNDGSFPKELVIVGPAGTGKTWPILAFLHTLCVKVPHIRVLICRQTRRSLTESVLATYEKEVLRAVGMTNLASGARRDNRSRYEYPNGSEIVLGGLDKPDKILSTAWDVIYPNEATELNEAAWDTLGSRLDRPGRPRWLGFLLADTNPGDPSHWLKKRCDDGRTTMWTTTHESNPLLYDGRNWTEDGEAYLARLDRLRGTRRKRLRDGLWAAGEGQWFDCFSDHHVNASKAAYDPRWPVHLAVDSGVHTGAVWFQVRENRTDGSVSVHVFGDYYAFNRPAYDAATDILERTSKLCGSRRIDRGTTDPAGGSATSVVGPTVFAEYARAGLYLEPWPSFPGAVLDGLALVDSFVSVEPPSLFVHPDCSNLVSAFANYKRAKRSNQYIDRPEDPQHPHEELMDALRGGLQDKFPDGRRRDREFRRMPARQVF